MADQINDDNLLESVLDQAFSAPPSRRQSVRTETLAEFNSSATDFSHVEEKAIFISEDVPPAEQSTTSSTGESSTPTDEWGSTSYEAQVNIWRAQSAEAREKAGKERARWEAIRAAEQEEAARRKAAGVVDPNESEWEAVGGKQSGSDTEFSTPVLEGSPSPADARDLVTGEHERQFPLPSTSSGPPTGLPRTFPQQDTIDSSQKWEDVHSSVTSSFPSMSFPERTETPSPSQGQPVPQPEPLSATLAIFDSSLSTRTRVTALVSSVAINLLLPFVNGVMLGFGEIFAKNFIMEWIGWKSSGPGSVAGSTGIGISSRRQRGGKQTL
ncbi:hypothetical protein BDQ12DRAFT_680674 [Crucibulum laeve]|uniref:Outer membrane protein TOM13-domain-containing protein n=1 Tax=Crucibulum laeve TaxID=68775 RepID=A0A5C3M7B1_9AGAR|nr:hypothetical protein BDQ12DRAFT_680674 [Crucibulum laeve]